MWRVCSQLSDEIEFAGSGRAGSGGRENVLEVTWPIHAGRERRVSYAEHLHFLKQTTSLRKLNKTVTKIKVRRFDRHSEVIIKSKSEASEGGRRGDDKKSAWFRSADASQALVKCLSGLGYSQSHANFHVGDVYSEFECGCRDNTV